MYCEHKNSGKGVWFPAHAGDVRLHPFCRNCGVLKNVDADHGRGVGYFSNALSEIKKTLGRHNSKLTESQARLILQDFEDSDYSDTYWVTFTLQKKIFIKTVRNYTNLSFNFVAGFL